MKLNYKINEKITAEIEIVFSSRKTLALEIKRDGRIFVRSPFKMPLSQIERFINEKRSWLEKHIAVAETRKNASGGVKNSPFTRDEIEALARRALEILPDKTEKYAEAMGVRYNRITVRNQVSRWGSCSGKGNLNFNCLLALCPENVVDYVVIHELCHLVYMNHSADFWKLVEKYCLDYKNCRNWLKNEGSWLITRLRE